MATAATIASKAITRSSSKSVKPLASPFERVFMYFTHITFTYILACPNGLRHTHDYPCHASAGASPPE